MSLLKYSLCAEIGFSSEGGDRDVVGKERECMYGKERSRERGKNRKARDEEEGKEKMGKERDCIGVGKG